MHFVTFISTFQNDIAGKMLLLLIYMYVKISTVILFFIATDFLKHSIHLLIHFSTDIVLEVSVVNVGYTIRQDRNSF